MPIICLIIIKQILYYKFCIYIIKLCMHMQLNNKLYLNIEELKAKQEEELKEKKKKEKEEEAEKKKRENEVNLTMFSFQQ